MSRKRPPNKQELIRFRASFTEEQKIAIVGSLFRMAFADHDMAEEEAEFVAAVCELLGYTVYEEELRRYVADPLYYLDTLRELSEEQQIWYCRALYFMIVMDGKVEIREIDKLHEYLEIIGIDEDTFRGYVDQD